MNKYDLLQKMLIQPKKLELKDGICAVSKDTTVKTNCKKDFSFLMGMLGRAAAVCDEKSCEEFFYLTMGNVQLKEAYTFCDDEAYEMDLNPDSITITAKTEDGLLLGLKALIRMTEELGELPAMHICDWPDIGFRSVHMCVFRPNDGTEKEETSPEYLKKMIRNAALTGYNHCFIEFWGMFPYSRDYAHWPEAYDKATIEDIVSYAMDKMHIRPLPAQNLCGHAGWSRIISRQHCVLDQRPDLADMYIPGGWCFDTENPDTKEFIKFLIDELCEMFRDPPYLHCCCDKTFGFGSTEEGRVKPADMLFAEHICFLNSYLQSKNVTMLMWADMLYSSMDALYWKCDPKTTEMLPKNIVMDIWTHNDPGKKWHDVDFFEGKGFKTVYSPFMTYMSIKNMIALCANKGSHGMVQTTWHRPQSACPYVILSGALQWSGKEPSQTLIDAHKKTWYDAAI